MAGPMCAITALFLVFLIGLQQASAFTTSLFPLASAAESILVKTTYSPIYIFNNGIVDGAKTFTAADWTSIQTAMGNALLKWQHGTGSVRGRRRNRQLPSLGNSGDKFAARQRKLTVSTKCASCKAQPLCLYQSGIGCMKTSGGGRQLQEGGAVVTSSYCTDGVFAVDAALLALKTQTGAVVSSLAQCAAKGRVPQVYYGLRHFGLFDSCQHEPHCRRGHTECGYE